MRKLLGRIKRRIRALLLWPVRSFRYAMVLSEVEQRWARHEGALLHNLPGELIVSLTSYPRRYPTLLLTIKCLLRQSVCADRTILWVSHSDFALLPNEITCLVGSHGFEIRITDDIRSYTKIIPALRAFPDAYITTADDDVYYQRDWLERMVNACASRNSIVCHRAHGVRYSAVGEILPYSKWEYEANDFGGTSVFPTGVGGVLYGPESLAVDVLDEETFLDVCPRGDDVWLCWMGHRAGSKYIKLFNRGTPFSWKGSQEVGLLYTNVGTGENDIQIARVMRRFGHLGKVETVVVR